MAGTSTSTIPHLLLPQSVASCLFLCLTNGLIWVTESRTLQLLLMRAEALDKISAHLIPQIIVYPIWSALEKVIYKITCQLNVPPTKREGEKLDLEFLEGRVSARFQKTDFVCMGGPRTNSTSRGGIGDGNVLHAWKTIGWGCLVMK